MTMTLKAKRLRAVAISRKLFQRRFRRLCEVPTCPCFAASDSLLCAGHGAPAPVLLPEPGEPDEPSLPFEVAS